jgi:hypothetical protein
VSGYRFYQSADPDQWVTEHVGHASGLVKATHELLDWAAGQGLTFDVSPGENGERWGCRLEIYLDEPGQDMSEWETQLAFRLAD